MYEKVGWKIVLIVFVVGTCAFFAFPPFDGMVPMLKGKLVVGYDIRGGTMVELAVADPSQRDNVVLVLKKRADQMGLKQLDITAIGDDGIQVVASGELSSDIDMILKQGVLEFKEEASEADSKAYAAKVNEWRNSGEKGLPLPPDGFESYKIPLMDEEKAEGKTPAVILVKKRAAFVGMHFSQFYGTTESKSGRPAVGFDLFASEAIRFGKITQELKETGRRLAIILNGEFESAPAVASAIESGRGIVTFGGQRDPKEAAKEQEGLLLALNSGVLTTAIEERSRFTATPSLGADQVSRGIRAIVIGVIVVLAFILVYYWGAGLVANFAMVLNIIVLLGILCAFKATFSLLGIAGLVLTIGMSIDANILVFERIREEKAAGKALRGAMNAGYQRAFRTILDANVTTIGTALILLWLGTGPIKAFAIVLTVGIAASMFTALFVTRVVFTLLIKGQLFRHAKMLQLFKRPNFKFFKAGRAAGTASLIVIVLGLGFFIFRGTKNFGIDFLGGGQYRFNIAREMTVEEMRDSLSELAPGTVAPEVLKVASPDLGDGPAYNQFIIRVSQEVLRGWVAAIGKQDLPEDEWVNYIEEEINKKFEKDFPPPPIEEDFENSAFRTLSIRMTYEKRAGMSLSTIKNRLETVLDDMKIAPVGRDENREIEVASYVVRDSEEFGGATSVDGRPFFEIEIRTRADQIVDSRYRGAEAEDFFRYAVSQLADRVGESLKPDFTNITEYDKDNDAVVRIRLNLEIPTHLSSILYDDYIREITGRIETILPEKVSGGEDTHRKYKVVSNPEEYETAVAESGLKMFRFGIGVIGRPETYSKILKNAGDFLRSKDFQKDDLTIAGGGEKYPIRLSPGGLAAADEFKPKVARELRADAFYAIVLALTFIILYIWFRFRKLSFGIAAVVALLHDVLITLGAIALFDSMSWFDVKFDLPIVAAILTVIGYSLNDTIVVFDRIRENMLLHRDERYYKENINNSINQTLSRTVWTSATTFFVVFILALFGGETLRGFALVICVGVVVGTYSSIFVASPIVAGFHRRALKKQASTFTSSRKAAQAT